MWNSKAESQSPQISVFNATDPGPEIEFRNYCLANGVTHGRVSGILTWCHGRAGNTSEGRTPHVAVFWSFVSGLATVEDACGAAPQRARTAFRKRSTPRVARVRFRR